MAPRNITPSMLYCKGDKEEPGVKGPVGESVLLPAEEVGARTCEKMSGCPSERSDSSMPLLVLKGPLLRCPRADRGVPGPVSGCEATGKKGWQERDVRLEPRAPAAPSDPGAKLNLSDGSFAQFGLNFFTAASYAMAATSVSA